MYILKGSFQGQQAEGWLMGIKWLLYQSHGMPSFITPFLTNEAINVAQFARINIMSTAIFCLIHGTPFDYTELSNM